VPAASLKSAQRALENHNQAAARKYSFEVQGEHGAFGVKACKLLHFQFEGRESQSAHQAADDGRGDYAEKDGAFHVQSQKHNRYSQSQQGKQRVSALYVPERNQRGRAVHHYSCIFQSD